MSRTSTTTIEVTGYDAQNIQLESLGYPDPSHSNKDLHRPNSTRRQASVANNSIESLTNAPTNASISKWRATLIVTSISGISLIGSMLGGIIIVALPTMARDIHLSPDLLLWPAGVGPLACGCLLLIAGSFSDVIGARKVYLVGELLIVVTTVATGIARTGIELILFRAASGVAQSLCIPASVSLITKHIPSGTYRNVAFACLGAGQPVGFSVGLVIGGVFVQSVGWRYGYYIGAGLTFIIFLVSLFGIPRDTNIPSDETSTLHRLKTEIDWVGCTLLSTSLGLFSYVFSVLASGARHFTHPLPITLLIVAIALLPLFIFYSRRQERLGLNTVLPPSLWSNRVFNCLCITVFVVLGVFEAMQYFLTLYFQTIQTLSPLQTSLRFLPMVATGTGTNILTGWLVKRVRADILVFGSAALSTLAPLLMAIIQPQWSYWSCAFLAVAFTPICADVLFTVSNLVITSIFPPKTHGVAGSVFNTISNIGNSFGLAITAVVASSVTMTEQRRESGKGSTSHTLMDGYRATFWLCFAVDVAVLGVIAFGLKKIGKVGIKAD